MLHRHAKGAVQRQVVVAEVGAIDGQGVGVAQGRRARAGVGAAENAGAAHREVLRADHAVQGGRVDGHCRGAVIGLAGNHRSNRHELGRDAAAGACLQGVVAGIDAGQRQTTEGDEARTHHIGAVEHPRCDAAIQGHGVTGVNLAVVGGVGTCSHGRQQGCRA